MKTLNILPAILFVLWSNFSYPQKLASENTIELGSKAKRGYLGNVVVDDAKQQLDLVFVTKSTNRKVKFDVYQFDYDLKLKNKYSDEQEVEKAKTKYNWFGYRGKDEETITGISAEATMAGKMMFVKREISYKYNWFTGRYTKTEKVLEKVKPKSEDDGKKMFFYSSMNVDEMGEVVALGGVQAEKLKDDPFKAQKVFRAMRVNNNLDIVNQEDIIFENPQRIIYSGIIKYGAVAEGEEEIGDWALMFAPIAGQGYGKIKSPTPTKYTYVRIGRDGKVKEKTDLETKVGLWKIDAVYEKEGSVYIYGLSKKLKKPDDAYMTAYDNPQMVEKGFDNFQLAVVKDGKIQFVSAPGLSEFETKTAKPDNQKKPIIYEGGRLHINGFDIASSGDIFVNAQEWSVDAAGSYRGKRYHDFMMFHFSKNGDLVKVYGVDNPQKTGLKGIADPNQDPKYYPTQSVIFEGTDKNSVYWMQFFIGNVERRQSSDGFYTYTWWTPRKQVRMGKIDISAAKIGSFTTFGDGAAGGKKFYLMNEFPSVKINGGKQTVFIGEDTNIWGMNSSGDYLWMGKFDPANL